MADIKQLKTKIASTKNIRKITNALEIISTLKLQKVKKKTEHLREYTNHLLEIVDAVLMKGISFYGSERTESKKELFVVVSSEKGLCGSLNTQLFKFIDSKSAIHKSNIDIYAIGKKAIDYFSKRGYNIVGSVHTTDLVTDQELVPLFSFLDGEMGSDTYATISVYYNFFKNTMKQIPVAFSLKPFDVSTIEAFLELIGMDMPKRRSKMFDVALEPNEEEVKNSIKGMIINYAVYGAVLHNKTGEFAARMLAMKGAKDNASTIIDDTTLLYNKARQDAITQEVSEIVSAKAVIDQ